MKNKLRKYNTYKIKYEATLEEKLKDKEKIIELQQEKITVLEKYNKASKELKELKKRNEKT